MVGRVYFVRGQSSCSVLNILYLTCLFHNQMELLNTQLDVWSELPKIISLCQRSLFLSLSSLSPPCPSSGLPAEWKGGMHRPWSCCALRGLGRAPSDAPRASRKQGYQLRTGWGGELGGRGGEAEKWFFSWETECAQDFSTIAPQLEGRTEGSWVSSTR